MTDPEPTRAAHRLLRHEPAKLLVTPHLASASIQTRDKMSEMGAANVLAGVRGEPLPNSALEDAGNEYVPAPTRRRFTSRVATPGR